MKKIIAIWLSINLLALNALPANAQIVGKGSKQIIRGLTQGVKLTPQMGMTGLLGQISIKNTAGATVLGAQLNKAALSNMRLPLTTNYAALLQNDNPLLPPARQILSHNNAKERALLLRSDFVALALNGKASKQDIQAATEFYRNSLKAEQKVLFEGHVLPAVGTVSDIASLGLLGNKQDAELIYQTALKAQGTGQEAIVTTAAARALLRLEAYEQLEALSITSTTQPQLWEGLGQYAQENKLPFYVFGNENGIRNNIDISDAHKQLATLGPLNQVTIDPSVEATYLYMNAGRGALTLNPTARRIPVAPKTKTSLPKLAPATQLAPVAEDVAAQAAEKFVVASLQTASMAVADEAAAKTATLSKADLIAQTKSWIARLKPKGLNSADETKFTQRAALYLTAFSIGLEIGTPIMASIKTALNLPLSLAVLVTVATYSPYLFGSFIANWLKGKIGRKGTVNAGLALMGGSFALGATALGLDGSFTAWDNQIAQFLGILGSLTAASTGAVFIHGSVGPVMTEISHKASELVRQKRGTYVELSRSIGMMASFAFPFIATSMLGLDWSAPFLLALPIVGASALTLNTAKLPNTKPDTKLTAELKTVQSPVMDGVRKPRKAMKWKDSFLNNSYVRLLREEPGVGSFISGLFIMNAVEMGINSGFLFMIPQLTNNESLKYLLGMGQFAVPFLLGRYLAGHFLKWFPKRSLSIATTLGGASALAALGLTDNMYAFTAALATSELGISTAFTLAFARTAINPKTQDRITSLIMATAVACAVGPMMLTWVAEGLMGTGIPEASSTLLALIGIPSALAAFSASLFRRMENKTIPGLKSGAKQAFAKVKNFFKKN